MGKMRGSCRVMRWSLLWSVLAGLLAVMPLTAVGAADPGAVPPALSSSALTSGSRQPQSIVDPASGVSRDPRLPGNHAAEQAYFAALRQAPPGVSAGYEYAVAARQTQALPAVRTLPGAAGGKGQPVGDRLAPPSAVWTQLGPATIDTNTLNPSDYKFGRVGGRVTALVSGPYTGVLYAGFADGGVWKSVNDGASWTPLTDGQSSLAVGSLALDPADTTDQTLYVGTGENNFAQDSYRGIGILKTTDGGETWTTIGQSVFGGSYTGSSTFIGVLRVSGTTVWAGARNGLYRSTDSGATWSLITVNGSNANATVTDVAVDGANVYAVLSYYSSGLSTSGIYKSTTGASGSFNPIMTNLPAATTWGRAQLAMAPSLHTTLYITIAYGTNDATTTNRGRLIGVYKTTNGGTAWAATTQPADYFCEPGCNGAQGWYDNVIAVDPTDPNLVYAGGVNVVASTNGGGTWATIADVYGVQPGPVHPDQHAMAFGASGTPHPLYLGDDGGVWKTINGNAGTSTTWADLNSNFATLQFYSGDAAANYSTTPAIVGGTQDNGTPRSISPSLGIWNGILGGDGMFAAVDKTAANTVYAEYAYGYLYRTADASAGAAIAWTQITPSNNCNGTLFVAPFALDPNAASHNHLILGGGGYVCETTDGGANWNRSNSNNFFGFYVQSVAIAPANSAVMYAGMTNGNIWRTVAGNTGAAGVLWTKVASGLPAAPVTSITVDRNDPTGNTAYATFGNFGVGHVWKTTTGGATWTNISTTLPNVPVESITSYPSSLLNPPILVIGTDVGVFLSTDNGGSWSTLMNGLPTTTAMMVFTDTAMTTLFVATHGRGMWKMPIPAGTNPAPTVTAISPTAGPPAGGTSVTVTGAGFQAGASVFFDGVAGTNVVVVNSTTITAVTPAHQTGSVNVTVTNSDNHGGTLNQGFTFGIAKPVPPSQPPGSVGGSPSPLPGSRQPVGPIGGSPSPLPAKRP